MIINKQRSIEIDSHTKIASLAIKYYATSNNSKLVGLGRIAFAERSNPSAVSCEMSCLAMEKEGPL
jgi:hypothetical protein